MNTDCGVFPFSGFYTPDDFDDAEKLLIGKCEVGAISSSHLLLSALRCNQDVISCLHLNCRSVDAHRTDIDGLLSSFNSIVDVCFLTETWFQDNAVLLPFHNYQSYHVCRASKGGGVSILIRDNMTSTNVKCDFKPGSFEYVCRLIDLSVSVLLISVYRPPSSNLNKFFDELDDLLHLLNACYDGFRVVLAGDFNVNLMDYTCNSARFVDLVTSHAFFPTIFVPTRPVSNTLLDNIFISWPGMLASRVLTVDISDHLPVLAIMQSSVSLNLSGSVNEMKLVRSFSNFAVEKFRACLANVNWEEVYADMNPTSAYKKFVYIVHLHFHEYFLLKIAKSSNRNSPRAP